MTKTFKHLRIPETWQHYWTRYPQGYTILEALFDWVSQVNEMVDNQNKLNEVVENVVKNFDKNLQDQVIDTLSEWQESGFLDVVIDQALQTQIDEVSEQVTLIEQKINNRGVFVGDFGCAGDGVTDDGPNIQRAIDFVSANGGGTVLLMRRHLINTEISIPSNVIIKPATVSKIKSTALTNVQGVFIVKANAENVEISNLIFDFESKHSCIAIKVLENVKNINIHDIIFKNFYAFDNSSQQNILNLKTGISGNIYNLSFHNIKCVKNDIIGDSGGAGRCIRTDSYGVSNLKPYSLNLYNIHIEDCYNVDEYGQFTIEDFDPIHFQHTGVNGNINVSNITAKNFSKRLFKIQAGGVNISNVTAESVILVQFLFGIMADNVTLSNVNVEGNIRTAIQIRNCKNVKINNVYVNSNYTGGIESNLISIINAENVNIEGGSFKGGSGFVIYGEVTKNIYVNNVHMDLTFRVMELESRNEEYTPFTGGEISNIVFNNLDIYLTEQSSYNGSLIRIEKYETNPISDIYFKNVKLYLNNLYPYGVVRIRDVNRILFENASFTLLGSRTDTQTLSVGGDSSLTLVRPLFDGIRDRDVHILDNANVLITRGEINTVYLIGPDCLLEIEKTTPEINYLSGATESQVTIS